MKLIVSANIGLGNSEKTRQTNKEGLIPMPDCMMRWQGYTMEWNTSCRIF